MKDKKQLPLEQKEKAVHGERIFPLKKYLTTLWERYPIVTPHWHEEAEFTLITEGACTYQVDLESFQAMPGDLIFIPPLALHSMIRRYCSSALTGLALIIQPPHSIVKCYI